MKLSFFNGFFKSSNFKIVWEIFCKTFVDMASKTFFSYGFKKNVSEKMGF